MTSVKSASLQVFRIYSNIKTHSAILEIDFFFFRSSRFTRNISVEAHLRAEDRGYRARLADVVAGLA